ncbi:hypothetical protein M2352_003938 [Azospirillum fermentarium]|uniref:hypothetical protein n=1 Tax=Azospirillum fermentarium TaxID=1233114 RepID=UPI00222676B1|nr:hypothetical protein [Azospirillum fermentarium]MCW2248304.1 hypothetical protein [Azospirillum fermentarium]
MQKSILIPGHDPLTHAVTDEVTETAVNGEPWPAYVLRELAHDERLAAIRDARRVAYPPVGDQLDALARCVQALADAGAPLPPETARWLDDVAAVKAAYPKPPEPE